MGERRKAPRYMFGVPAMLHPAGGGVGTKVLVRMMSTRGCSIEGAEGLSPGKKCELYVDWRGAQIGLQGKAVSGDAEGNLGLKFLSVDRDTQRRLSDLCDTLRIQSEAGPPRREADADSTVPVTGNEPQLLSVAEPPAMAPSPAPAKMHERRRVPRYVSDLPARVSVPTTGASSNVTLITLSVFGGCVEGSELPESGQECQVSTEWEGRPLRLPGRVVWKSKEGRLGVRFASLDEEAEKSLRQVCTNLWLQPMAPLPPEPQS
ncbi:MAG TPA: PilZ domain-containing protein [Terriglobia bacterium]|nr:PilZ domain-containing protein [Terriglobia bacterium]